MNQYRRIVSYLYKYGNGKKGENTGFVRVDTREEGIRLHFHIKDLRMMDERKLKVYFYFHEENGLGRIFVDEFLCVRGNCEYKKMVYPDFAGVEFDDINGVIFLDQHGLLYGSCWDEREISADMLSDSSSENSRHSMAQRPEKEKIEILPEENQRPEIGISEVIEEETVKEEKILVVQSAKPASSVRERKIQAGMETVLSRFPEIKLDGPDNLIEAVSIELKDIAGLSPKDWKLADNAFLKQAYEMDDHLLLGKIRMQNEKDVWILGVPGIYDNREKYLAGIFGFSDYIPKEKQEFKTGGRGYWIRQISGVE